MGLDMYLYKVDKLKVNEVVAFHGTDVDNLPKDISYYDARAVEEDESDLYKDLLPYMQKVTLKAKYFDLAKMKQDNDIPEWAGLCGQSFCDNIAFTFNWKEEESWKSKTVKFGRDDYTIEKESEFYLCKKKEIYYWRKAYDVQEFIHDNYNGHIKNCGYHKLDAEFVSELREFDLEQEYQGDDSDYNGETEDVFYYEWY